ncbi:hypothetical protein [Phaeobacter piscinae]|uniref:hypothetical protein n=1 Tax=Phaeobacter piscinae TaxID=1580596 RepID=UPI000C9A4979|nr:hypothetical protein [Phaeobacter piscinae]AUQ73740.1 hypothetical protein PhaeoP71_00859 [Phaeobacter piscinae]
MKTVKKKSARVEARAELGCSAEMCCGSTGDWACGGLGLPGAALAWGLRWQGLAAALENVAGTGWRRQSRNAPAQQ